MASSISCTHKYITKSKPKALQVIIWFTCYYAEYLLICLSEYLINAVIICTFKIDTIRKVINTHFTITVTLRTRLNS